MDTPNKGEMGVGSIRIAGSKVDDLPIAESYHARTQLPAAADAERATAEASIRARYPVADIPQLEARIAEARHNVRRFRQQRRVQEKERGEYQVLLALCQDREKRLRAVKGKGGGGAAAKRKAIRAEFPPYKVEGLKQQIKQFSEGIERFDGAVETELATIVELREAIVLCEARDREIARLR